LTIFDRVKEKHCSKCSVLFPVTADYFYLRRRSKDGFESYCKSCAKIIARESRVRNQSIFLARKREHYIENREEILARVKKYLKSEKGRATRCEYKKRNIDHIREVRRIYELKRRQDDPQFKLIKRIRGRVKAVLKSGYKSKTITELIGCSADNLKEHLESKFTHGMSWENHGEWHIDHIIPCASFDLSKPEQQKSCFNYKNLQPLWAIDNLRKNSRVSA
jgi:hypothetical protein